MIDALEDAILRYLCSFLHDTDKISLRHTCRHIQRRLPFNMIANSIRLQYFDQTLCWPRLCELKVSYMDENLYQIQVPPTVNSIIGRFPSVDKEWATWHQLKKINITTYGQVDLGCVLPQLEELCIHTMGSFVLPNAPRLLKLSVPVIYNMHVFYPNLVSFTLGTAQYGITLDRLALVLPSTIEELIIPGCYITNDDVFHTDVFPNLKKLNCSQSNIKMLFISPGLVELNCSYGRLTGIATSGPHSSLRILNIHQCMRLRVSHVEADKWFPELVEMRCDRCMIDTLTFSDKLEELVCNYNNLTRLECSPRMRLLECNGQNIEVLANLPSTLITLHCSDNEISQLDLRACSQLEVLYCNNNYLTHIECSSRMRLLECKGQSIEVLENLPSTLTWLHCSDNKISQLDLRACSQLNTLRCSFNRLETIDVSNLGCLQVYECEHNRLTTLGVLPSSIEELICSYNNITSLGQLPVSLVKLECVDCNLSSLDVRRCPLLTILNCASNKFTSLDVSSCTELSTLNCDGNQLKSLDTSMCNIGLISCSFNVLQTLSVHKNTIHVICISNKLKEIVSYSINTSYDTDSGVVVRYYY